MASFEKNHSEFYACMLIYGPRSLIFDLFNRPSIVFGSILNAENNEIGPNTIT